MTTVPLNQSAAVILDGSGAGTARLGPVAAREAWTPERTAVHVNEDVVTLEARCRVYMGSEASPPNYVDGTLSGSTGDSTDRVPPVQAGQYVWAVWAGGDPGAQGYVNVTGTKTVG